MKRMLKRFYLKVRMAIGKSPSAVLMLHSINAKENDNTGVNLSKNRFEELLDILVKFSHIGDVVTSTKPSVALSFDDGRSDIYDDVYPLLKKKQIPFTIFVTYNLLDSEGYLTKEQLIELSEDKLVSIGSHCLNHVILPQQTPEIQFNEIVQSKRKLEELLQISIDYIAYPYGQYNQDTLRIMRDKDIYKYGFVAGGWFFGENKDDRHTLSRMNMSNKYYKDNLDLLKSMKKRMK